MGDLSRVNELSNPIEQLRPEENKIYSEGTVKFLASRNKSIEQLRQLQKLEDMGRVAGSVAHDFNNILAIISGYADIALQNSDENATIREDLIGIKRAIEYGRTLTKQLLTFSHRQPPTRSQILELNGVISDFENFVRRLTGQDIELVFSLQAWNSLVEADAGQIEQILMNLVVNARDAMPKGGKLTIETKDVHLDQEYVTQYPEVEVGNYVMLAVTDTGIGMDRATLSYIFEPFYSTKGENGTGLGLATVYGIVKQHNGHIRVYSELNTGTTFKVYLPSMTQIQSQTMATPAPVVKAKSAQILVVEDDPVVRPIISKILQKHGYKVIEAQSGEEALEIAETEHCNLDLIITDVTLPGITGVEFAHRFKAFCPDKPFIFSSGYTELATNDRHLLPRDAEFIEKPFSPSQLMAKIQKLIGQKDQT